MSTLEILPSEEAIAGTTVVSARRIGLIGDDHNDQDSGSDLPDQVFTAFEGVDLILHLGHMGGLGILGRGVLDRLAGVAPVLAVRDYSNDKDRKPYLTPADGDRVAGLTRIIEANGIRIGMTHNPARPPGPEIETPPGGLPDLGHIDVQPAIIEKFGGPVDVVAYASTHRAAAIVVGGVLFVSPGSPTYPKGPGRTPGELALGTVGTLDLTGGVVTYETVELSLLAPS
jgi:predicted phosphodiesterase